MKQIVEVSRSCLSDKINDFIDILDALPRHTTVTRTKRQFDLILFGLASAGLTMAMYNAVQISKLENKMASNKKKLDHLINITNLYEQHFKAVDQKIDNISNQLAIMLQVNKVHFVKITDLMEQKFAAAITIS
jgi:hypothetical protein